MSYYFYKIISICILSLALLSLSSCDNNNTNKPEESIKVSAIKTDSLDPTRFPNDRSELALLMRSLYDELKEYKKSGQLNNNGKDWKSMYAHMKTATPTESKNSGPVFEAFSDDFLTKLDKFQNEKDSNQIVNLFNGMIETCVSCHQEFCPGPIEAIKKLNIN